MGYMLMQIISFGLLYVVLPYVWFMNYKVRSPGEYLPAFIFGGFFLIATICCTRCNYNSSAEYVEHTKTYG